MKNSYSDKETEIGQIGKKLGRKESYAVKKYAFSIRKKKIILTVGRKKCRAMEIAII